MGLRRSPDPAVDRQRVHSWHRAAVQIAYPAQVQRRPGAVVLRVIAGLVVGVVLLSGCAAKEKASTSLPAPTSTAAPTTAALPPLGPPDFPVPAAARTKDAAGA